MNLLTSLNLIILITVVLANIVLSIAVFNNDKKSSTNITFSLLSLIISIWLIVMYFSLHLQADSNMNLTLIRLSIFFAAPMTSLFFLFANTLPAKNIKYNKNKLIALGIATLVVMLITISPYAFIGIEVKNNIPNPIPGLGLIPFGLFTVSLSIGSIFGLINRFKNTTGSEKQQLYFVIIGMLLMLGLITLAVFSPVVFLKDNSFVQLFPIYTLFFTGLTAYAILRHGLFNLRVLAAQAFTVIIGVVLFSKLFVSQSTSEMLLDLLIFLLFLIFGILLVRSVYKEVEQRQKLQDLTEQLKAMDKQKDTFISMAAHELRAPMTAIKGYISMVLEGDMGVIPDKARGFLEDANNINDRLVRLVNNMLNVSRIEEGRMVFTVEEENLSNVVRTIFPQFAPEAERKRLEYSMVIPPDVSDKVKVDPDRIQEVLGNFISNAIKYTDKGFVRVEMRQTPNNSVWVGVIDSGSGIAPEEQKKLFQKFQRVESNVGKTTGTGLGLYISKLLVDKFGGKIGIISDLGKGSTFWFELPLVS